MNLIYHRLIIRAFAPRATSKPRYFPFIGVRQYLCISAVCFVGINGLNIYAQAEGQNVAWDALEEELGVSIEIETQPDESYADIVTIDVREDVASEVLVTQSEFAEAKGSVLSVSEIVPSHDVVTEQEGSAALSENWFYVGMIDYTLRQSSASSQLKQSGQIAYYVNGTWEPYTITSSAETEFDGRVFSMPWRADNKKNHNLLSRMSSDEYYPIYGDGSSAIDHTPSRGDLYFSMQSDHEHLLWGNFKPAIRQGSLIHDPRALYGASLNKQTKDLTSFGEPRAATNLYMSIPDSFSTKNVLNGTGGSVYFLNHPDLIQGSETVIIETRDRLSDRVISRDVLTEGKDYTIDYFRGTVVLNEPLTGLPFSDVLGDDEEKQLAVLYQYFPSVEDLDTVSLGASGAYWFNDHIRVQASMMQKPGEFEDRDYKILGTEMTLRVSDKSSIRAEFAQSSGEYSSTAHSRNGGIGFDPLEPTAHPQAGEAYKIEANINLDDILNSKPDQGFDGAIGAYFETQSAGFSNAEKNYEANEMALGACAKLDLSENHVLNVRYDEFHRKDALTTYETELEMNWQSAPGLEWRLGAKHSKIEQNHTKSSRELGERTDLNLRFDHQLNDAFAYFGFAQATLAKDIKRARNNQLGAGAYYQINATHATSGEASIGDNGLQGELQYHIKTDANNQTYFGYQFSTVPKDNHNSSNETTGSGFVVGQKQRHSDKLTSYHETALNPTGASPHMSSAIGVSYDIAQNIRLNAEYEMGEILHEDKPGIDRRALSLGVAYNYGQNTNIRLNFEHRDDRPQSANRTEQTTLFKADFEQTLTPSWQMAGGWEFVKSNTDERNFYNSEYMRADLGFAYRPIHNDRLNALMLYSYVREESPSAASSQSLGQNSHVFAIDAIYDVNSWLSLGGKYGLRVGEMEPYVQSNATVSSAAQLAVIRSEFKLQENIDFLAEYRKFSSDSAVFSEDGGLVGIFKDLNENYRFGGGYNFTSFSDDLTDLNRDHDGFFFNVLAKF